MRGQRPNPLVEQVDHRALRAAGQGVGKGLHQHERRAQVRLHVAVPGRTGGVVPLVALEHARVVDQDADGAERSRGGRQQGGHGSLVRQVRLQHGCTAAGVGDLAGQPVRLCLAVVAVDGDAEPGAGQCQHDGPAQPDGAAGDKRGPGHVRGELHAAAYPAWLAP